MTEAMKLQLAAAKARKELRALAMADDTTAEAIQEKTAEVENLGGRGRNGFFARRVREREQRPGDAKFVPSAGFAA